MMGHQSVLHQRTKTKDRRHNSMNDRVILDIFPSTTFLTDMERAFLVAAKAGDLAAVQDAINVYHVNNNIYDELGQSALELALSGDHLAVAEYLLPRSNLQNVEDALLYAISQDNIKLSELILDHALFRNHKVKLASADGFFQQDTATVRLKPNITPIALAAQRDNFKIVQLLLDQGSRISPPHDYFCDCIECSNMRVFDSVKYSRTRLGIYRALASPAYISLSTDDPILTAFQLSHTLERLADIEKEYKREYRQLSESCKDYAVELLEHCRSTEEIMAILNEDNLRTDNPTGLPPAQPHLSLARVKLALKYEQKRFISHPACQHQLISLWYSGVPWMRHQRMIVKLLSVPLATLLLPVSTIIFLLAPNTKVARTLKTPFVKFLNHTCSYIVFLSMVLMATLRGGSGNTWLDMACSGIQPTMPHSAISVLMLVWVVGMFVHECRQLWRESPMDYFCDWWNWMDSSLILLYLASFSLQIVVYVKVFMASEPVRRRLCPDMSVAMSCREMACVVSNIERNWTSCSGYGDCSKVDGFYGHQSADNTLDQMSDMNQLSDIFSALASVLSFARIAHLLPANEQLGPLLVSFGKMLHDVLRFGIVFILVFLAFMTGLTTLYRVHKCENNHFSRLDLSLSSLFWATFGMGDTKATLIDNRYLGSNQGLVTSHTKHNPLVVFVGYGLFCSYIAGAVVVLLNMLIAMMSNSFQEIYDDRDVEWKFARAKLWIDYFENGCTLPMPFNLIPNPKHLWRLLVYIRRKARGGTDEPPIQLAHIYSRRKNGITEDDFKEAQAPSHPAPFYKQVTKLLIQRFIYQKEREKIESKTSESDVTDLCHDVASMKHDVNKLRHELSGIRSTIGNYSNGRNGCTNNSTMRKRIELHV